MQQHIHLHYVVHDITTLTQSEIELLHPPGRDFKQLQDAIKKTKEIALQLRLRATDSYNFFFQ